MKWCTGWGKEMCIFMITRKAKLGLLLSVGWSMIPYRIVFSVFFMLCPKKTTD